MACSGTGLLVHIYFLKGHSANGRRDHHELRCSGLRCCACVLAGSVGLPTAPAVLKARLRTALELSEQLLRRPRGLEHLPCEDRPGESWPLSQRKRRLCEELTTRSVPGRVLQGRWAGSMVTRQGGMGTN